MEAEMATAVSTPVSVGRFVWLELATPDPDAAIAFYSKVVGWSTTPFGGTVPYTMWTNARGSVGGVMAITPEMQARGVPPHWISYVSTADCDATLRQVTELGGQVRVPATDIPNVGRFGVFSDPQGPVLALLTPQGEAPPRDNTPQVGDCVWHELATTSGDAAFEFYRTLFGWEQTNVMEMGPGNLYRMYGSGGQTFGGIYSIGPDAKQPPSWIYYIEVADVDRAAKDTLQLGGKVLVEPMDVPGGRVLRGVDPQGAQFALHTTKHQ
jgi:uncharacterized protein